MIKLSLIHNSTAYTVHCIGRPAVYRMVQWVYRMAHESWPSDMRINMFSFRKLDLKLIYQVILSKISPTTTSNDKRFSEYDIFHNRLLQLGLHGPRHSTRLHRQQTDIFSKESCIGTSSTARRARLRTEITSWRCSHDSCPSAEAWLRLKFASKFTAK